MSDVSEETPETHTEEAERLQKLIAQGMPTDTEMRQANPRTVQRHLNWEKANKRNITRYQELRAANPSLPSVEALRIP